MALPAITAILNEVGNRLANITVLNEYNYDMKKIERARLKPFNGYDLPAISYWSTSIGNERNSYNDDNRAIELYVECHNKTMDEPFIDIANLLAQDVITSLVRTNLAPKVSDLPNYDLNETVQDFVLNGWDFMIGEGQNPFCGILVSFTIKFTTDPFEMSVYSV